MKVSRDLPKVRVLLRVALVLLALVSGLLVAELGIRALALAPTTGVATVTESDFERLPGIFTPGQRLTDRRVRHLPHQVTINSLGYRGGEIAPDGSTQAFRVLVLGDSFTYGDFVDDHETLPARLEALLADACSNVEVINAGVPGSGIVTQEAMLERGLALDPDLAILIFTANDVTDLIPPTPWEQLAANREAKSSFPMSAVYPLARRTALWNLGLQVRGQLRAAGRERLREDTTPDPEQAAAVLARNDTPARRPDGKRSALLEEYVERLVRLHDRTLELAIPLQFVIYPSHHSISNLPLEDEVWIEEVARQSAVPTLNLLPSLLESGLPADSLYLLPWDGHPSPRGYAVAARALRDVLTGGEVHENCAVIDG